MRYCDAISERVAPRTQRDRQEQILRWRRIALALRVRDTLPESFAAALAHCVATSPLSKAEIARTCGITYQALRTWCSGTRTPRGESLFVVARLEQTLVFQPIGIMPPVVAHAESLIQSSRN